MGEIGCVVEASELDLGRDDFGFVVVVIAIEKDDDAAEVLFAFVA